MTIFFEKHLDWLSAVTKALNGLPPLDDDHFYLDVKLRYAEDPSEEYGHWSDELGEWCFDSEYRKDGAS